MREAPMAGYLRAVERLRDLGAELVPLEAPEVSEALACRGRFLPQKPTEHGARLSRPRRRKCSIRFLNGSAPGQILTGRPMLKRGRNLTPIARVGMRGRRVRCGALPTSPILPPDAGRLMRDQEYYVIENLMALRNTRIGNLMGSSAMSLPTGLPSCGLMMLGAPMAEERLLRVAAAVEAALQEG